jgi:lipopolysaccharide/colanic/teichoic acid biosynthesis glycosyltransferase
MISRVEVRLHFLVAVKMGLIRSPGARVVCKRGRDKAEKYTRFSPSFFPNINHFYIKKLTSCTPAFAIIMLREATYRVHTYYVLAEEGINMAIQTATTSALPIIEIRSRYVRAKRVLDILFTLLIFIPLCLVMAIIAVCIRLDSKGSIFYRQKRVGLNGVEFDMLKFRSMYANSNDALHRQSIEKYMNGQKIQDDGGSDMSYKQTDDPRITRVGRFIRKTSLDELPQFLNVLRGEMSLVGPRPPVPYEVERYSQRDWLRLAGKPGLTGTWQVYGRSKVTFQDMVTMDIDYLQRQSLPEDLKLIFLTVPVMIQGRGGA